MTTIGDLTPNMIGKRTVRVRHQEATIEGRLMGLDIEVATQNRQQLCRPLPDIIVTAVAVTVTLGSITIGPLSRDHECKVIA